MKKLFLVFILSLSLSSYADYFLLGVDTYHHNLKSGKGKTFDGELIGGDFKAGVRAAKTSLFFLKAHGAKGDLYGAEVSRMPVRKDYQEGYVEAGMGLDLTRKPQVRWFPYWGYGYFASKETWNDAGASVITELRYVFYGLEWYLHPIPFFYFGTRFQLNKIQGGKCSSQDHPFLPDKNFHVLHTNIKELEFPLIFYIGKLALSLSGFGRWGDYGCQSFHSIGAQFNLGYQY